MILESHRVRMLIVTRVIFMQTRYRRCESTRADVGPNEMCAQNVGTNTFLFVLIWPAQLFVLFHRHLSVTMCSLPAVA